VVSRIERVALLWKVDLAIAREGPGDLADVCLIAMNSPLPAMLDLVDR